MSKLSDAFIIRGKQIKNRIVMPPMMCFTFQGDNGGIYGRQHVDHYTARARGGAGLIIVQATFVAGAANDTGVWSRKQLAPLKAIAANCRRYGAAVMLQLALSDMDSNTLTLEQLQAFQADTVAAAQKAYEAGFDGIEMHFAHGYTLNKLLDPTYNKRTDRFGGSLENRARFLTEIIPQLRAGTGENFILCVRMGGNVPDLAGAIETARLWEKSGIDLLHISFGMQAPVNEKPADFAGTVMAYNASEIKKHVHLPVIAVSGITTAMQASYLIENDYVDFVAVGRGMFADENWANKVLNNEPVDECRHCGGSARGCFWFTDHTKCPARKGDH